MGGILGFAFDQSTAISLAETINAVVRGGTTDDPPVATRH
jgi:hypothetical protein